MNACPFDSGLRTRTTAILANYSWARCHRDADEGRCFHALTATLPVVDDAVSPACPQDSSCCCKAV
jgi:hypothetical protein